MKTLRNILKLTGLCAMAALLSAGLFTACFSALDAPGAEGISAGKGAVQITIGDSNARTAFPAMTGVTYAVSATKGGDTVPGSFTGSSGSIELDAGTWSIIVDAKNTSDETIATATKTGVVVAAGKSTEVIARLTAATGIANGTFAWAVDFPDSLDTATLNYTGAANAIDINTTTPTSDVTAIDGTKRNGTISLAPGVYLVTVNLAKDGKAAGDVLAVHIYSGLTTTKNDWLFTADSLIASKPLAVSVDINHSNGVTVTSAALTLNGDGSMTEQEDLPLINSGGNTWTVNTNVPDTVTTLAWNLEITTTGETHTAQATGVAYATPLTLDPINIYTLTASVGEHGSLNVNGTAYASVREFLGGASVTLTAVPAGGYKLDQFKVDDVDQTSPHPFTISADTAVVVTFEVDATVDPNVIWEWSYDPDGWTNLGAGNTRQVNGKTVLAGNSAMNVDTTNGGASINVRAQIGSALTANSTTNTLRDPNGEFDFWGTDGKRKIQVTAVFNVLTSPTANRTMYLTVNNNTSTPASAVHSNSAFASNQVTTSFTGEFTLSGVFNPSDVALTSEFTAVPANSGVTIEDVLKKSFIGINYSGSNSGTIIVKSIKIEYVPAPPPGDPNLIFEWSHAENGAPAGMTWSTGANAAATVSTAKLTGTGKYTEVPISIASAGTDTTSIAYNNGIHFAADTANARILVIGAGFGRSVVTGSTSAPIPVHRPGGFDFLNDFPVGKTRIQVTLTIANFTGGGGNFTVTLNNNTTGGSYCPLTPTQGGGARIIYHATPNSTAFSPGNNGAWNGSTTYTGRAFKAGDFSEGSDTLATAFIGIAQTANASSNVFTITGIKIEYVD